MDPVQQPSRETARKMELWPKHTRRRRTTSHLPVTAERWRV